MVASNTLLIKHLPNILNDVEKEELLRYFGAKEVKCISSKRSKYNIAFARFENEGVAENVLHRLHQVNILGACLCVEFSKNDKFNLAPLNQSSELTDSKEIQENEKLYKQFMEKLTSWHSGVDFKQPVPSHLKYQYPPPNMQTLLNIVKVLATVPKFYTQVLHLMNKMNLPCPFGKDILPDLELDLHPLQRKENMAVQEAEKPEEAPETSDSEISTDEESKQPKETIPEQFKMRKKTKIKVPKFFKPPSVPSQSVKRDRKTLFEEVFEKVRGEKEAKKIKLSHSIPIQENMTEAPTDASITVTTGFGYIHPLKKVIESEPPKDPRDEREEERLQKEVIECISGEELSGNRISEKDRSVLAVFKNYAEGAPTCRLYVKNLAKTVTEQDLRYIYMRYLPKIIEDEPNMFDIRLMQEGRMKGQAFVTLQNVELAQKALKETNGYILKDKPLVVQFARSATK